jgi:hypothetical protein
MMIEAMILGAIVFAIFVIWAHLTGDQSTTTTSGGRALKKIASNVLNMDMIKGGYKAYKKIKA